MRSVDRERPVGQQSPMTTKRKIYPHLERLPVVRTAVLEVSGVRNVEMNERRLGARERDREIKSRDGKARALEGAKVSDSVLSRWFLVRVTVTGALELAHSSLHALHRLWTT